MQTEPKERIKHISNLIIARLKQEGFTIQLYEAYTTNSVYIKLDYGVCNSIRISDHSGKKHLKYKYNVILGIPAFPNLFLDGFERKFYTRKDTDQLLADILEARQDKLDIYGEERYKRFMKQNREDNADKRGFWKEAVEV